MSLTERLKNFDAHSSASKEFRVYTTQGAILSVVTVLIVFYLVVTEFYFNFQVTLQERVHVNETSSAGLEMAFDVSLNMVPCSQLSIDSNDPTGQSQSLHLDKKHHVWKHRIRMKPDGKRVFIGNKDKIELGSTLLDEKDLLAELGGQEGYESEDDEEEEEEEDCGSCYGAGEEGECCNTCDDVRRAYKRKGWMLNDPSSIKQCKRDGQTSEQEGEGCNVHGIVALSTGGGNLHLAPGRDIGESGGSVLDQILQTYQSWNVTHTIHSLRFGPQYPAAIYQLDGEKRTIEDGHGMYQYYIQIIPTLYRFRNGTTIQTNQYSVTEHLRHVNPGTGRGLPGVFFFYEVSPLHVEISEVYRRGWVAFLTSLCAIIGGVVTVASFFDQYLFHNKGKTGGLAR